MSDFLIKYDDKQISNTTNTNFIGLFINDTCPEKHYLQYIIPQLPEYTMSQSRTR